jgi:copper chaperone NosL
MSLSKASVISLLFISYLLFSCNPAPKPIKPGKDSCSFCKMSIADKHFGAEIISKKGKVFKFDDMHCLLAFIKENSFNKEDLRHTWLVNYDEPHNFIPAGKAFLLKSNEFHSPMGGNIASFETEKQLAEKLQHIKGEKLYWDSLIK